MTRIREAWLLVCIAAGALLVRVWLPFDRIVHEGRVNFQEDAWYHARAIEHLVHNFPYRLTVDPYAADGGQYVGMAPLFDYVVASMSLAIGLGSPSARLIEIVAAVTPALLGAGATLLVYAIGRRLFDARAGLLAAAALAVTPGHFLDRTRLGAADHHAAESVLVLAALLIMIIALQAATADPDRRVPPSACAKALAGRRRPGGGRSGAREIWRRSAMPWLAGIALGAYCLTWTSAALFIAGLCAWLALQFTLDLARSRPALYLPRIVAPAAATALLLVLLFQDPAMFRYASQIAALTGLLLLATGLHAVERVRLRLGTGRMLLAGGAAAAVVAVAALGSWIFPGVAAGLVQDAARLDPVTGVRLVGETQPLFTMGGEFSWLHPWGFFRATFYVALPSLVALASRVGRRGEPADSLLLVWALVALAATLGQNRFGYYLVPMLALLAGWGLSALARWTAGRRANLAAAAMALVLFYPGLRAAVESAGHDKGLPAPWREALTWLRQHTPDPFGDPAYYFAPYDTAPRRAAYTVMNWWDYGYWIMREGRRVPVSNPTQSGAYDAARFLAATTEADARAVLDTQRSRYVLVDRELVYSLPPGAGTLQGKFGAIARWAGEPADRFFESMFQRMPDGRLVSVRVFYPDYYRSMAVRLYLHGTEAVQPANSTWVISYEDRTAPDGNAYRELVGVQRFATYAEAQVHLATRSGGQHRIAGRDPLTTCVPLLALTGFRLLHDVPAGPGLPPAVRIFESLVANQR